MLETTIHEQASAALNRLYSQHPNLKKEIGEAYGYVVFPSIGRAGVVLGGAYGHGEVYEEGQPIGFATLTQITVGVQVGGHTFTEVVLFKKKEAFDDFKVRGRIGFSAHASAVVLKAAASGTTNFSDVVAHAYSSGGMLIEASLGGSKMMFFPPMEREDGHTKLAERNRKDSPEDTEEQPQDHQDDGIVGGAVGRQALDKLASTPVLGRMVSSLRFLAPVLPHKKGEKSKVGEFADQLSAVRTEKAVGDTLHKDVLAAIVALQETNPKVAQKLSKSYGYAVFPSVGRASIVLGGATGKGEVFEQGKLVGYAQLVQVTIGVQLGGQTFSEFVLFPDKKKLDAFKAGKVSFAANAAAVIVKAGAAATTKYQDLEIIVSSEGGLLIEAAIGGQKFFFKQAVLTKGKSDDQAPGNVPSENVGATEPKKESQIAGKEKGERNKSSQGAKKVGRFEVEEVSR